MVRKPKPNQHPADLVLQNHNKITDLLKIISHAARLIILCLLAKKEMTAGELNEHVPLSQSAVSQHLAVLRSNGLVTTRRDALTIYYQLTDEDLKETIESLYDVFCR